MKKTFLKAAGILFFVAIYTAAFSQKQNVYFLKNDGKQVSTKDSADYVRILSEPDSGSVLYNVKDYYLNGKPRFVGKSAQVDPLVLDGSSIMFYPSGKRKEMATYNQGRKVDDVYNYFPNGKPYSHINYFLSRISIVMASGAPVDPMPPYFVACNDSTGKSLTVNGSGHFIVYDDDMINIREEGPVESGRKNGEWKGITLDSNRITYTEKYSGGVLVSGTSVDKFGIKYRYTHQHEPAAQIKQDASLFQAISLHRKQPSRVSQGLLTFWVNTDGSISNIAITAKLDDASRLDILKAVNSKKWNPARFYGVPIPYHIMLPISSKNGEPLD